MSTTKQSHKCSNKKISSDKSIQTGPTTHSEGIKFDEIYATGVSFACKHHITLCNNIASSDALVKIK